MLAGFLVIVFALAAWRGWANARVMAVVMAVLGAVTLVLWLLWRSRPASRVEIDGGSIAWHCDGKESIRFGREVSGHVALRRRVTGQGAAPWRLVQPDVPGSPSMDLFGYNVFQLRDTCTQFGWQVSM